MSAKSAFSIQQSVLLRYCTSCLCILQYSINQLSAVVLHYLDVVVHNYIAEVCDFYLQLD